MNPAKLTNLDQMKIAHDFFTKAQWALIAKGVLSLKLPHDQQAEILEKIPSTVALIAGHKVSK